MRRSPNGKRQRRRRPSGEGNDLISNLPLHLITCILDLMPIQDAARTSILSKTWKNIWLSRSFVHLGREFCDQLLSKLQEVWKSHGYLISEAVDNILLSHQGPIFNFSLFIPQDVDLHPARCDSWMSLLSTKGVEHLELLNFWDNSINSMPSHYFYFPKLLSLRLCNYSLHPPQIIDTSVTSLRFTLCVSDLMLTCHLDLNSINCLWYNVLEFIIWASSSHIIIKISTNSNSGDLVCWNGVIPLFIIKTWCPA